MDIYCPICSQPWDMDTLHDEISERIAEGTLDPLLDHLQLLDQEEKAECAGCVGAAVMAALGWDDYYCRKHKETT